MSVYGRYTPRTFVREIVFIVLGLVMAFPFYILVVTSLKSTAEAATTSPMAPPHHPTLAAFREILRGPEGAIFNITDSFWNSVVITVASIVATIALASITAYTISRRASALSNAAYLFFVVGVILPVQLGLIPLYIGMRHLGLLGTTHGMVLLYTGQLLPLTVFLYAGFLRAIPREYEEAALVDGASRFMIFWKIVLPLTRPVAITIAILQGTNVWNDFFTQLVFLNGSDSTTIPVALSLFTGAYSSNWNNIFALVTLSILPVLLLFVAAQKKFMEGFAGGLKG